jgi:hypothetical protein
LSGILVIRKSEDSIMVIPPHYLASGITAWIGNPLLGRRATRVFLSVFIASILILSNSPLSIALRTFCGLRLLPSSVTLPVVCSCSPPWFQTIEA